MLYHWNSGSPIWATVDAAMMVSDVFLVKSLATAAGKGFVKLAGKAITSPPNLSGVAAGLGDGAEALGKAANALNNAADAARGAEAATTAGHLAAPIGGLASKTLPELKALTNKLPWDKLWGEGAEGVTKALARLRAGKKSFRMGSAAKLSRRMRRLHVERLPIQQRPPKYNDYDYNSSKNFSKEWEANDYDYVTL